MSGLVEIGIGKPLLIQVANFLLLLFLLNTFLFKPIIRFLESRRGTIHGNREAAKQREQEAKELLKQYLEAIERSNREAFEALASCRREGELRQREAVEDARRRSEEMLSKAVMEIKEAGQIARDRLREDARRASLEIAEKLLGRSLA